MVQSPRGSTNGVRRAGTPRCRIVGDHPAEDDPAGVVGAGRVGQRPENRKPPSTGTARPNGAYGDAVSTSGSVPKTSSWRVGCMIEISHGWTPTTPAIQPAEVLGPDPDHPVEELVGVLLEAAEVLGLEQPHAAGCPRISTARSLSRVWSSLGTTSARRASGVRGDVRLGLVHGSGLPGAVADDLGEGDCDDQAGAVEGVLDPALVAQSCRPKMPVVRK